MSEACPISHRQIDETVVRLVALQVFVSAVIGCIGFLPWIAAALTFDFFIRAFTTLPISPLAQLAKLFARKLKLKPNPINAGPKIFAARIGFFFAVSIAALGFMDLMKPAMVLAIMLAVCAGLESFLSICVGCHLYSLLNKIRNSGNG